MIGSLGCELAGQSLRCRCSMQLLEHGIAPALEPEEPIRTPPVVTGSPRRGTVPTGLNLLPSDGEA